MERRIATRAIIVKDGKIFAVKLKDYKSDGAKALGRWITIGGKVEPGEQLLAAIEREVFEEVGVKPVVGNLLYIQQFSHHEKEQLEFFFHITNADDFETIDLSKTSHGEEEIAEYGFIEPATADMLPAFLSQEDLSNLKDQPTKFFSYL